MNSPDPHLRTIGVGFAIGAIAVFVLCVAIAAALGESGWPVVVAGLFVGLFAGGGLGALIAFRIDQARGG